MTVMVNASTLCVFAYFFSYGKACVLCRCARDRHNRRESPHGWRINGSSLVLPIDHLDFYFYHYRGVLCALYVCEGSAQQTKVPAEVGGGGWHAVDWVLVSGATVDSVHGLSVGPRWLCFTVGGLEPELGMIRWSRP